MQQIPLIDLFKSAIHISGDKLAHPQEHFLTAYTAFGTMHRYCCRPVGSNIGALYQTVYTVKMCTWGWASLSPETCRADSNRSIKRSINENCCILLVAFIVDLMMHGLTNIKFTCDDLESQVEAKRFSSHPHWEQRKDSTGLLFLEGINTVGISFVFICMCYFTTCHYVRIHGVIGRVWWTATWKACYKDELEALLKH